MCSRTICLKFWRKPDVCTGDALHVLVLSRGFCTWRGKELCLKMFKLCRRTDSEIFEDSVELQQFFIRIRDELCKNGEILLTPALSYTTKHLHSDVEKEKKEKLPKEYEEDKLKREEEKKGTVPAVFYCFSIIKCNSYIQLLYCETWFLFLNSS